MVSAACAVTGPEGGASASRFDYFARRRAPRARIACSVRLRCEGAELTGTTTDVSMVGLFVATRHFLGDGTKVQVSFAVGCGARAEPVEAEGWVVRRVTTLQAAERGGVAGLGIQLERFRSGREALQRTIADLLGSGEGVGEAAPAAGPRRIRTGPDPDAIDELALAALAELQAAEPGALRPELASGPEWRAAELAAGDLEATLPLLRLASMRESRGQLRWLAVAATSLKVAALVVALLMTGFGVLLISRV